MRTHPSNRLAFPDYARLNPVQRRRMFDRENPDKEERKEQMRINECYPFGERGIRIRDLPAGSRVPAIIAQQQWEGFIRTPQPYCIATVINFYACMIPAVYHDRCVVKMGDKEVRISPEDIDTYLHAPRRPELGATYGLSAHPAFQEQMSPMIAASLRRNGHAGWDNTHRSILKSEMHTDIAFLMLFIKASLKPSTHNTTADSQVAEVLYSLQHNLQMDIGHIIWMEILDAGMTLEGVLPFPCLITHFCREAGVPIGGQLTAPMRDFTKTQYKHQITAAAKLEARRRVDPDHQRRMLAVPVQDSSESASDSDPDFDPVAPPQEEAEEHTGNTPPYFRQYMDRILTRIQRSDERHARDYETITQRLDGFDTRLANAGFPAPPQAPPQGRRRVRGRREGGASSSSRR